jgi:hypothetical protein
VTADGRWGRNDLGYCSNVHPGESLDDILGMVAPAVGAVRAARGLAHTSAGLWLSGAAVEALADPEARSRFRAALDEHGIRLRTLNAFPYGDFHAESVKEGAFLPDWSDERRLRYTLAAADVLAECLALDAEEGTVSTVPLGLRAAWSGEKENAALGHLLTLAQALDGMLERTGRVIRVCLEPEPGGALERTDQAVAFFDRWLLPAADALQVPREVVRRHLGICYDVCHQAVMFEDAAGSLARLLEARIPVGKIQLSCALEAPDAQAVRALADYAEPRYLHQVRVPGRERLYGAPDLGLALADPKLPSDRPWRAHFHVPVHAERFERGLISTQAEVLKVFDFLAAHRTFRPHLEVETYTWQVLPGNRRPRDDQALVQGIAAEIDWVEMQMRTRGLLG